MLRSETITSYTLELLKALSALKSFHGIALAGGTALALQSGHRISIDLDFFSNQEFDEGNVLSEIQNLFSDVKVFARAKNTLNLEINTIKVDVISHQYSLIEPFLKLDGFRMYSMPDLAAMKTLAAVQRGSKKDFYDLLELMDNYSLDQILDFHAMKYGAESQFHVIKSLTFFEDADLEPDPISLRNLTWAQVKAKWLKHVDVFLERLNK